MPAAPGEDPGAACIACFSFLGMAAPFLASGIGWG